jgi:hypothetical protein
MDPFLGHNHGRTTFHLHLFETTPSLATAATVRLDTSLMQGEENQSTRRVWRKDGTSLAQSLASTATSHAPSHPWGGKQPSTKASHQRHHVLDSTVA